MSVIKNRCTTVMTIALLVFTAYSFIEAKDSEMTDAKTTFCEMKKTVDQFLTERDWYQFHSPAADSRGPVVESSELLALFLYSEISAGGNDILEEKRSDIEDELGDVCTWLMCFANVAQISPTKAILNVYSTDPNRDEDEADITISDLRNIISQKKQMFFTVEQAARGLSLEAVDLMRLFLTNSSDGQGYDLLKKDRIRVEQHYADLVITALIFAELAHIDFSQAFEKKLEKTKQKYPIEKAKGNKAKYTDL